MSLQKKAVGKICKVLVDRGDFDTIQEAFNAHQEDFVEMKDMLREGDPFEVEDFFTDNFGLEPDLAEGFIFAFAL